MSLHQGQAGGESCTLLRPPLPAPPKTLFPEHKLTGGSSGSGKDSLSYPAVMGCRFSLALGAVCPHPAVPALPRGSLRSGPGVTLVVSPFAVTAEPGASQPSARRSPGAQQVATPRSHLHPLPPAAQSQPPSFAAPQWDCTRISSQVLHPQLLLPTQSPHSFLPNLLPSPPSPNTALEYRGNLSYIWGGKKK